MTTEHASLYQLYIELTAEKIQTESFMSSVFVFLSSMLMVLAQKPVDCNLYAKAQALKINLKVFFSFLRLFSSEIFATITNRLIKN
jgi:hypothetical protein